MSNRSSGHDLQHLVSLNQIRAVWFPAIAEAPQPAESSGGGIGGFFESLKERFQPDAAQQSSTEGPSSTEGAEGKASPPPALTAGIEADTDKKSDTPAVQSLIEGVSQCWDPVQ